MYFFYICICVLVLLFSFNDYNRLIRYLSFCTASLIHVTRRTQRLWQLGVDDHVMILYFCMKSRKAPSPPFAVYNLGLLFSYFSF